MKLAKLKGKFLWPRDEKWCKTLHIFKLHTKNCGTLSFLLPDWRTALQMQLQAQGLHHQEGKVIFKDPKEEQLQGDVYGVLGKKLLDK